MHPLTAYIERNNINRAKLSRELHVSRTTITRWIQGNRKIDADKVGEVSEKTGIPVKDLRPDLAKLVGVDQ